LAKKELKALRCKSGIQQGIDIKKILRTARLHKL
jgi:hypothetical protein